MLEIIKAYINMHKADKMIDRICDLAGDSDKDQDWAEIRRICDNIRHLHNEVAWTMWRDKGKAKTFNDTFNNMFVPAVEKYIREMI